MAKGAGGEVVIVYFPLTDGTTCEAIIPARTWSRAPNDTARSNRQWWLDVTKTPWVKNTDLAPNDQPYDAQGAVDRFGQEVPWGSVGTPQAAPWQVITCKGIDYAFGPGVFIMIQSPDMYLFLQSAHLISTPHGFAPQVEENLRDFVREQALRGVFAGKSSDDQAPVPPTAVTGV